MDRWQNIDQAWDTGKPPPPVPRSLSLPLPASLTLSSLSGHAEFSVYTALSRKERADYYSVAIKSQFGAERLCGHLTGHNTRQIISPIEMDGAAEVGPKCPLQKPWTPNKQELLPTAEYRCAVDVVLWQQWVRGSTPASEPGLHHLWGQRVSGGQFQFIWAQSGKTI